VRWRNNNCAGWVRGWMAGAAAAPADQSISCNVAADLL